MRITVLQLLLAGGLVISASAKNAHGQGILDKRISLSEKGQGLKKVLHTIEQIADVKFTYDSRLVASRGQVNLDVRDEDLKNVLDGLLSPLRIGYEVVNDQIILKKETEINPTESAWSPGALQVLVTGTITGKDGNPIPGASITVRGTQRGASTNANGKFQIKAESGDVLVISAVGYGVVTRTIHSASDVINVTMQEQSGQLTDVVVTALGIKREARSLGYSDQKVSGQDMIQADPPNIATGLIGKAAGLDVSIPNGVEGSSSRIVIRGINSLLGNNQPLIVVDGVMVDNEPILPQGQNLTQQNLLGNNTDVSQNQSVDYGSFLNTINPDDIESFNILKGPTAAVLYGARGANGVILITTKKGGKEKGLGLEYNLSERWNDPYRYMKLQHEYGMGMTTALTSANPAFNTTSTGQNREETSGDFYGSREGTVPGGSNWWNYIGFPGDGASWGPKMTGQPLLWWDGTVRPYTANNNIFKSYYKQGNTSTQNVSFSGGGDVGTLRVSYTRTGNDAITYNSNFTQNVFNIGSSINVSKKVKAEATVTYSNLDRLNPPNIYGESSTSAGVGYVTDYHLPMDYKPLEKGLAVNADGSQNSLVTGGSPSQDSQAPGFYWWNTLKNNTHFYQNQLLGNVKLTADVLPWLNATGHVGIDYYTNQFETRNTPVDAAGLTPEANGGILYANDLSTVSTENLDAMLTAHKDNLFKDFNASLSVGTSWYHNQLYDIYAQNPGPFNYPFTYNLTNYNGTNPALLNPKEVRQESDISSAYALANLSYKRYLYLELSGRNDWSSTLPQNKWSFFYPGANLSFVFTDAFNMGMAKKWLSYGKIRVADAGSANGYIPYQTAFNYTPVGTQGYTTGLTVPTTLPSPGILPQRSRSFETGVDLGFFNNRINLNFTYYNIYSYDQILPVNVATSSGADRLTINTGALRNSGIEFVINATALRARNFTWNISLNGANNINRVVSLAPGISSIPIGSWFTNDGVNMNARVGDQYGTIYGYDYQYMNGKRVVNLLYGDGPNTGNGQVIGAQYATTANLVKIGNATPKLIGGIGNTFTYKDFSLYVLTDFKVGGQIWSGDYASIMGQGEAPETTRERDGHGLPFTFPDGTKANVGVILPGVTPDGKTNAAVVNSWWKYAGNYQSWDNDPIVRTNSIFTNSWGKLREVSLTYRLPASFARSTGVFQSLSVSLIGRDLFYLFTTLPDRLNPEGITGTTNTQGMQFGELPGVRSFGFSVKAGF